MKITRGSRRRAEAEHAEEEGSATLQRRKVLGGLAALPVLYSLGGAVASASAAPVSSGPAAVARATQADGVPAADAGLVRGQERRYHAPLLSAGARLSLPAGVSAVAVRDFYHGPHLASATSAWPYLTAADGTRVDASVVPEAGAPTRVAILSGFAEGWYELAHANGRADRVTWDARKLPFLWMYGEFGATNEAPYHKRFYTLALQPLSANPYSRTTRIR
ncbi:hypothetical protein [Streptacidiphilus pinicola]|uniref:hypothetical protein n=1 Tax=Streptacidiphilus pinicola TaxID=2219663 RepID=UPI0014040947|nr:hypothetical protein [Streptacidiphilus pinicola]